MTHDQRIAALPARPHDALATAEANPAGRAIADAVHAGVPLDLLAYRTGRPQAALIAITRHQDACDQALDAAIARSAED